MYADTRYDVATSTMGGIADVPAPSTPMETAVVEAVRRYAWLADGGLELPLESSFPNLGIDSMSIISIAMELEQIIDRILPDEFFVEANFASPAALIGALSDLLAMETP